MTKLRFNGSVWINLDVARRHLSEYYKRELNQYGLSIIELDILKSLYEQEPMMASALAQSIGRAPTAFTTTLDTLVYKGYVERIQHPSDRRAIFIKASDKGLDFKEELTRLHQHMEQHLSQQYSDQDWDGYERVLQTFQHINKL